jgi:hypothetical protein
MCNFFFYHFLPDGGRGFRWPAGGRDSLDEIDIVGSL